MSPLERRAVSSLALLYSFRMLGLFMVLPLLSLYAADMPGASPAMLGLAIGAYGLTQALLQIPAGWLSDRIGRKPVIYAGLAIFALGSFIAAYAETIEGVLAGRLLQGAGAISSSVLALVADVTSSEQRTKAMAVLGISIGVSFTLAMILGPLLAASGGLAAVFQLTGVLALLGIAVVALRVPDPPDTGMRHDEVGARANLLLRSLLDRGLLPLNFGVFVLHFVLMASFLVVPGALENLAGIARENHWQVYLPVVVLSLLGMLPLLMLAERLHRLRLALSLGIGVLAAAIVLVGSGSSAQAVYLGMWLFFVAVNYLDATLPSMVSKTVFEGGKGTALGIYATCQFFGAFAGGALGGFLLEHYGATAMALACGTLVLVWLASALPAGQPAYASARI
ncbi:MAG: MFS transporter [Pseudomonadota bacterium]